MSVLFVDIETQRTDDPAVIKRIQESVKPPGQYKKAESITEWYQREGASARLEAVNKTSLDGTYGRLATVGYAYGDDEPTIVDNRAGLEKVLLLSFAEALKPTVGQSVTLVAFNGDFDFRFLMKRYVINRLTIPHQIQRALGTRDGYFDPMRYWEGFKGYISQAELESVLGITRDDAIDGSEVGEAIEAGDWDRVVAHNRADIVNLRQIYRRLVA